MGKTPPKKSGYEESLFSLFDFDSSKVVQYVKQGIAFDSMHAEISGVQNICINLRTQPTTENGNNINDLKCCAVAKSRFQSMR